MKDILLFSLSLLSWFWLRKKRADWVEKKKNELGVLKVTGWEISGVSGLNSGKVVLQY